MPKTKYKAVSAEHREKYDVCVSNVYIEVLVRYNGRGKPFEVSISSAYTLDPGKFEFKWEERANRNSDRVYAGDVEKAMAWLRRNGHRTL